MGTMLCESAPEAISAGKRTTFTLRNNCHYNIWPGTLSGHGVAVLGGGGFELAPHATITFSAPPGWSGRFWARTGCSFSNNTTVGPKCATGDCGGTLNCTLGGTPPVTLAEFTLANRANEFYD
jgi:Thaumatin family